MGKINTSVKKIGFNRIAKLTSFEDLKQAKELEKAADIRNPGSTDGDYVYYGIKYNKCIIAEICVDEDFYSWGWWWHDQGVKRPEVMIESLVVSSEFRSMGLGYRLRKHIQKKYDSIGTGTSSKSHPAIHILNKQMGFCYVADTSKTGKIYYWEKKSRKKDNGKNKKR